MDPSTLVRVCSLSSVRRAMQSVQPGSATPNSRCFGPSGGCALLGKFRVAERVETYDHTPFYIPVGCVVFSDYGLQQQPREEIQCQVLNPQPTWFGGDMLVLLTDWRYILQPKTQHSQNTTAGAFVELLSPPVLLPATVALSGIERPLSWWLKHRIYPELELESQFFADMRLASLLDSQTAATILASQRRRGNRLCTDDTSQSSSILGRISAVGSLMPTKEIGNDGSFGFLADISIDPASADGQQTPPVPVLLCGRRFLGLFASLGIGDSLFVSGLLPMLLCVEGADLASMFVTSPESRAYRIDDFDGLGDARVRLPVLSQQLFTNASQDSLFSRIEPSNAATSASGVTFNTPQKPHFLDSWVSSQASHDGQRQSQVSPSPVCVQKVESIDGHLLVHRDRVESYSGLITRVVDVKLGIYLVDDCHLLMLTYWPLRSLLSVLRPGTRVLVDNMHVLLLANSKGYHWSWLKWIWPQALDQPTLMDERRTLVFGACARSSVRVVQFADTADYGPMNSIIAENLAAYVAKRAGGLVRMVEAIEAFWKLQVKFPGGLSADSESSPVEASDCTIKIMDLALWLVGHSQPSTTGKPTSYRRLYLEFLDHGRCTSIDCMRGQLVSRVISLGDIIQRFLLRKKEHRSTIASSLAHRSSKLSSGASVVEEVQDATGWLQIRPASVSTELDDSEMLPLEFTGQALVGHIYFWGHWRLVTELVNTVTVASNIGASAGSAMVPFEQIYVVAASPTILYADRNFGCGSKARRSMDADVAQSILLLVHSQSPVAISPGIKKSKDCSDSSCSSSSSSSSSSSRCRDRTRTSWISVKGAGLKVNYSEFHRHIESGDRGTDRGTSRFNVSEATELLTVIISYDPDQIPVSLTPGCAYVVCVADPSTIAHYSSSGKYIQVELQSSCHVHPAWVTVTDCSGAESKSYMARQHRELLTRALGGDQPLYVPMIQIDAASSKILDLYCPPPVYPVRELHSLLTSMQQAGMRMDGNSRPIDIVSVYGTIAKRGIKKAVAFTSGSLGNFGSGKKRTKKHSDLAGLLAGRFDTRIVLHDDRDSESAVTLYIELSSFAHPLGLVPGTRVVVRDARLDLAKGTGRAYLRGAAGTSFQLIATKQTPDLEVEMPSSQATRGTETERVSISQLCGRHTNRVTFHCSVGAFELLRVSVSCSECKQAVCQTLCACSGRQHRMADKPTAMAVGIELICRVTDGSGVARLLVSDEATLAETLGLATIKVTELIDLAARSSEGQLLWTPQQNGQDNEVVNVISHAVAVSSAVTLRVEGMVQREHLPHLDDLRQPLRFGGRPVLVRQLPFPKVSVLRITQLTTSALCWQLLADLQ
ncbi:hypothetical protein IW152_001481 [Coemansia sp. BCRC 34962]|nr:hypothetical protein IW152_001481 [Coemansia sp. BCRC 34962]